MPPPAGYLDVAGIDACLAYIRSTYPSLCTLTTLPETTAEGRVIRLARLRAGTGDRNGVLLIGGTHARELINPDLLVRFALHLCAAYTAGTGLTYGGKSWSATDVRLVLEACDIFIVPQLNPDGRAFVWAVGGDRWWRKNRSVNAGTSCRGTDLNRNYDFLWPWTIGQTSSAPCSDTYKGLAAFSEPETRNIRWVLQSNPRIVGMVDVHSYSELLLHPWGDDDNQTSDSTQNFRNSTYDGVRGQLGTGYGEYIPTVDLNRFVDIGTRVRAAIAAVRGRTYTLQQSADLYPTSGVSSDYAYSRYFSGPRTKVWAWVFETNAGGFQPEYPDALNVMNEVSSGLIQLLLSSICLVREVGRPWLSDFRIEELRVFRDGWMRRSRRGRDWMALFEAHGEEVLGLATRSQRVRQAAERALKAAVELVPGEDAAAPGELDKDGAAAMRALLDAVDREASPRLKAAVKRLRRELQSSIGKGAVSALGRLDREVVSDGDEDDDRDQSTGLGTSADLSKRP